MSEFNFQSIERELPENLLQKSFIWIWNADKVPPHIGISKEKDYFSLTYKKSEHLLTVSMLRKARRSLVPLVLVEISKEIIVHNLKSVFSNYERALDGVTCLQPIRESLDLDRNVNQLSDLLVYLELKGLIREAAGLNLPEGYRGIPEYSMEDILKRIKVLNQKH